MRNRSKSSGKCSRTTGGGEVGGVFWQCALSASGLCIRHHYYMLNLFQSNLAPWNAVIKIFTSKKSSGGGGVGGWARQTCRVIVESRFGRLRDSSWGMIHKDVSNSTQLIKLHKVFTKIIHRDDSQSIAAKLSTRTVHDSQDWIDVCSREARSQRKIPERSGTARQMNSPAASWPCISTSWSAL